MATNRKSEYVPQDPAPYRAWIARFRAALSLMLTELPPDELFEQYAKDRNDCLALQDFVACHLRPPLNAFATGIGVLEAADAIADTPEEYDFEFAGYGKR